MHRMSPRVIPLASLALVVSCSGESAAPSPVADPAAPIARVLLVSCDTLRADRLGCYGFDGATSPNLDAFAAAGRVYEEAYSTTSLTHPAMSAVMTGRLPDEIGMAGGNRQHMPAEVVTLAEVLAANGVATGAVVSNWVLRGLPEEPDVGIAQGFDHFDAEMDVKELNREAFERAGPGTTDAAIAWMSARTAADRDAPFFLWVHYQDPHGPYTAPEEFMRAEERREGETRLKAGRTHSGHEQLPSYQVVGKERQPAFYRAQYDAEIRYFDHELGRLFGWLEGEDLLDDSLVVFTSDHGESLGEHDYWFCHGETLARELVRVPFIVRSPRTPVGRSRALAGHLDVFATVLDAFDLPAQASRGTSVIGADVGGERALVQTLFRSEAIVRREALSDGRWRLVVDREGARLFDIEADPGETRDLAGEHPDRVKSMQRELDRQHDDAPGRVVVERVAEELDEAALRALDALGYTEGEERP